ncbi:aldo/keto reductase [Auraticoccus sp. F435]|uniref:Aldo/keto reductase n=1 Tax=Auraticoccus cholistanensis TaxID=2656650 RepID=A0A6A9UV16_9ACTN|nr:aldo/keto reductase [Auraticoccus cholistanensis]MVA75047.1 aldo/keto reductase [Auraticoccus cholistanensis]
MTTQHDGWTGTRRLGRSGIEVSALGLGGWAIGGAMASGDQPLGYTGSDDDESRAAIRRGVELGVTLFDTADAYGAGHSERLLGEVLGDHPEVLVATKFGNVIDESTRQLTGVDVSPGYVRRAAQASLRRLRRERIDLYQLHHSGVSTAEAEDLVAVLEDLVAEGSVAWWGVSTDDPEIAGLFADAPHCTAMQIELNVLDDNPAMLALCAEHDLAALCRSPLAMGLLGGRYTAESRLPDDDVRGRQPEWLRWFTGGRPDPGYLAAVDTVREILTEDGRSLAQGALGWIWARDPRTVPLPGFRTRGQVEDDVAALQRGPLTAEQYQRTRSALDAVGR